MFFPKFLTAFFAVMVLSTTAHAEALIYSDSRAGQITINILIPHSNALAERLADVLAQSPLAEEVTGPGIQPKSVYAGEGFTFYVNAQMSGEYSELTLTFEPQDLATIITDNASVYFNSTRGAARAFNHAVTASKSPFAQRSFPGDVRVSQRDNANGDSLVCRGDGPAANPSVCYFDFQQ